MSPTFVSLFAGVGGFDLGLEAAGWDCRGQVEWDASCQRVLARHWPDVPRWGDVSTVRGADLPPVDLITFGSPCQDLSVAGKRAGLDGERSGLFHEATRIIKEMRDATNNQFPRWAVWENVAGALSSNRGRDFGAVLDALADAGALVIEWAVLDARWFGVPQRRRRVFVVACFDPATAAACPDPLLPVAPRSGWHPPQGNTAREDVAGTLGGGSGNRGWAPDTDRMTFIPIVPEVAGTLGGTGDGGPRSDPDRMTFIPMARLAHGHYKQDDTASQLTATNAGDPTSSDVVVPVFVKVVRSGARDADGNLPPEVLREEDTAPTLNVFDNGSEARATVLAFSHTQGLDPQPSAAAWPTLRAEGNGHAVMTPVLMRNREGKPGGDKGPLLSIDQSLTLATANDQVMFTPNVSPVLAFSAGNSEQSRSIAITENATPPLRAGASGTNQVPTVMIPALTASNDPSRSPQSSEVTQQVAAVHAATSAVRRLTPLECERLMGWPDDHTRWRADGTEQADSSRYKQCGNGVASVVAEWIGKHLAAVTARR